MKNSFKNLIIVLSVLFLPGIFFGVAYKLQIFEQFTSLIAMAIVIIPILFSIYYIWKANRFLSSYKFTEFIIISIVILMFLYLTTGRIGLFISVYLVPTFMHCFIDVEIKKKISDEHSQ